MVWFVAEENTNGIRQRSPCIIIERPAKSQIFSGILAGEKSNNVLAGPCPSDVVGGGDVGVVVFVRLKVEEEGVVVDEEGFEVSDVVGGGGGGETKRS
jgi:hypothetical protein